MAFVNPYRDLVEGLDLAAVLVETAQALPSLVRAWRPADFDASYAPGKWSGHRILLHLLHVELVDGVRLRMALSDPSYSVQPFDPEAWMVCEPLADGRLALAAWSALRAVNLELWRTVGQEDRDRPFLHPECGSMTLRDLAGIWAGHDLHHLAQLRAIRPTPSTS